MEETSGELPPLPPVSAEPPANPDPPAESLAEPAAQPAATNQLTPRISRLHYGQSLHSRALTSNGVTKTRNPYPSLALPYWRRL